MMKYNQNEFILSEWLQLNEGQTEDESVGDIRLMRVGKRSASSRGKIPQLTLFTGVLSRMRHNNTNKWAALTLTEVLITIGIIGVIAVLTIPSLLKNINNHKFQARFKKAVSTLAQGVRSSQAQYDINYLLLNQDSDNESCPSDNLGNGKLSMCGLFNSVLAGHSYQGVYGTVKGANRTDTYTITTTTQGFNPQNYLIYSLADGTLVGFKPSAKGCGLAPGAVLSSELMMKTPTDSDNSGLANCIGFIDVNGVQPPNKEVTCSTGKSAFDTKACLILLSRTAISDVFPIVFHDGIVEPATDAARAIMASGKGSNKSEISSEPVSPLNVLVSINDAGKRTLTYNGVEYELYGKSEYFRGQYCHKDEDGNLINAAGLIFTKTASGYEYASGSYTYVYDNDLNEVGEYYNGFYYDKIGLEYVRDADNGKGDLLDTSGSFNYKKTADGYKRDMGDVTYFYDNNLNKISAYKDGNYYEYKPYAGVSNMFVRDTGDGTGNLVNRQGNYTFTKTSNGYERIDGSYTYVYDNDLRVLGVYRNGEYYSAAGPNPINGGPVNYIKEQDNGSGNLVTVSGSIYTKRADGFYEYNGKLYDENLYPITVMN